jgi:hypothetical protein
MRSGAELQSHSVVLTGWGYARAYVCMYVCMYVNYLWLPIIVSRVRI